MPTAPGDDGGAALDELRAAIAACRACADLPLGPRPIVQIGAGARILSCWPGTSSATRRGFRLRAWLSLDEAAFRDPAKFAILTMGFCYPGSCRAGDLPPRPESAPLRRMQVLT